MHDHDVQHIEQCLITYLETNYKQIMRFDLH